MKKINFSKKKNGISKKIKVPISKFLESSHIEINSNEEVIIEGSRGVLNYDDCLVKVDMGKMKVIFIGRNLTLSCLTSDSLVVKGVIKSVEFIT